MAAGLLGAVEVAVVVVREEPLVGVEEEKGAAEAGGEEQVGDGTRTSAAVARNRRCQARERGAPSNLVPSSSWGGEFPPT